MKAHFIYSMILVSFLSSMFSKNALGQNVGINSSGVAPVATARLYISFADEGMLIPRVSLTGATDDTTIASHETSLVIYNTAAAGTTPDEVVPGYYFYNGSKWSPVGNNSNEIIYTQSSEIRRPVFTA